MNFLQSKKLVQHPWLGNIFYHRYLIRKYLIWMLGDGKTINFWYTIWLEDSPLVDKINPNIRQYIA